MLDTHVVIRWLVEPRKLSRDQIRTVETAAGRGETIAISDMSLLEIAMLGTGERSPLTGSLEEFFLVLTSHPAFQILPLTPEIALDAASLPGLRDPADRAIAATARVHRLRLVTSDQRIIESGLVPTVE